MPLRPPRRRTGSLLARKVSTLAGVITLLAAGCSTTPDSDDDGTPAPWPRQNVIVAVGDIVCTPLDNDYNDGAGTADACRHGATSDLVAKLRPQAVLALGDTQYDRGVLENYEKVYHPTWGRFKDITYPVPGNHEYRSPDAKGYFAYFGDRAGDPGKGYYSFDLNDWHVIALNSECDEVGGCEGGSPQERWLRADLAAHRDECVLAYMHAARFSSGEEHGSDDDYDAFWQALYDADAELLLSAHDHIYERFAPLDAQGRPDEQRGIRQFVVGTGGAEHQSLTDQEPGSEVADDKTYGVLELTLEPGEYRWRFVSVPDGPGFTDSGAASCH